MIDGPDGLDVLINAAGSGYVRSLGMMRLSRALLPLLKRDSGRKLVANISSAPRFSTPASLLAYAASDSAFIRLSEAIALQARGSPIEAVAIVRSQMPHAAWDAGEGRLICAEFAGSEAVAALVMDLYRGDRAPAPEQMSKVPPLRRAG